MRRASTTLPAWNCTPQPAAADRHGRSRSGRCHGAWGRRVAASSEDFRNSVGHAVVHIFSLPARLRRQRQCPHRQPIFRRIRRQLLLHSNHRSRERLFRRRHLRRRPQRVRRPQILRQTHRERALPQLPTAAKSQDTDARPPQPAAHSPRNGRRSQTSGQASAGSAHAAGRRTDRPGQAGPRHTLEVAAEFLCICWPQTAAEVAVRGQNSLRTRPLRRAVRAAKKFLKKFRTRRNPLGRPVDYPSESAGPEVVPHRIPARHFYALSRPHPIIRKCCEITAGVELGHGSRTDPAVIDRLMRTKGTWAIVGLTRNEWRSAYDVSLYVRDRMGMEIIPVNLPGDDVHGRRGTGPSPRFRRRRIRSTLWTVSSIRRRSGQSSTRPSQSAPRQCGCSLVCSTTQPLSARRPPGWTSS